MCKTLLIVAAALLLAPAAYAQEIPGSNPGSEANPLGEGQSVDCSDPLMAGSSLCAGDLNSATLRGGYAGSSISTRVPSPQPNQVVNYTDENHKPASRDNSTSILLPPEPLTEFQKFTASITGMVLPIFGANLFQSVPSTFAPLDNAPVPPDYVIGPDDNVRL